MSKRKTADIVPILWNANYFLSNSEDSEISAREAISTMINGILLRSNAYAGYSCTGVVKEMNGLYPVYEDESRRFYYVAKHLQADWAEYEKEKAAEGFVIKGRRS